MLFQSDYSFREDMEKHSTEMRLNKFSKWVDIIDSYVKKHRLIIGGASSIHYMESGKRGLGDYQYLIFAPDAVKHGTFLCNELVEHGGIDLVTMKSVLPNRQMTIYVDLQPMIEMWNLTQEMTDIIAPIKSKIGMYILPPEINLIELYRGLADPEFAGEWEDLLEQETRLIKRMSARLKILKGVRRKRGGAPNNKAAKERIIKAIGDTAVHVGHYAAQVLIGEEPTLDNPIEVISMEPKVTIARIKAAIQDLKPEVKCATLPILRDFRMRRYYIKTKLGELVYVYNSAEYDLTPYFGDIKIATAPLILRNMLVNVWLVRLLKRKGVVNAQFADMRVKELLTIFWRTRMAVINKDDQLDLENNKVLAPLNNFYGHHLSRSISKKLYMQDQKRYPDYNPVDYKEKYGQYKDFKNKN